VSTTPTPVTNWTDDNAAARLRGMTAPQVLAVWDALLAEQSKLTPAQPRYAQITHVLNEHIAPGYQAALQADAMRPPPPPAPTVAQGPPALPPGFPGVLVAGNTLATDLAALLAWHAADLQTGIPAAQLAAAVTSMLDALHGAATVQEIDPMTGEPL
jgi:hypothetical protein